MTMMMMMLKKMMRVRARMAQVVKRLLTIDTGMGRRKRKRTNQVLMIRVKMMMIIIVRNVKNCYLLVSSLVIHQLLHSLFALA